jgi:hypothetical protein
MRRILILFLLCAFIFDCAAFAKESQINISGRWIWRAEKDGRVIGTGEFDWKELGDDLVGQSKALIPSIKALPGQDANPRAVSAIRLFPLKGHREGKYSLVFTVTDQEGLVTKNIAKISADGMRIDGNSLQEIRTQGPSYKLQKDANGSLEKKELEKQIVYEYNWIAIRIIPQQKPIRK